MRGRDACEAANSRVRQPNASAVGARLGVGTNLKMSTRDQRHGDHDVRLRSSADGHMAWRRGVAAWRRGGVAAWRRGGVRLVHAPGHKRSGPDERDIARLHTLLVPDRQDAPRSGGGKCTTHRPRENSRQRGARCGNEVHRRNARTHTR